MCQKLSMSQEMLEQSEVALQFETKFGFLSPSCSAKVWLEAMHFLTSIFGKASMMDRLYIRNLLDELAADCFEHFPEVSDRSRTFVRGLKAQLDRASVDLGQRNFARPGGGHGFGHVTSPCSRASSDWSASIPRAEAT